MENQFERTELLLGKDAIQKLKNAHVAVFGVGGVCLLYTSTANGWVTVIRRIARPNIILYITRDGNGNYVFTESEVRNA